MIQSVVGRVLSLSGRWVWQPLFVGLHTGKDFAPPIDLTDHKFLHVGTTLTLRFRHASADGSEPVDDRGIGQGFGNRLGQLRELCVPKTSSVLIS
jgi:hypothetical protein